VPNRKERLQGRLGAFIQQYARPAHPGQDPNDRRYDREMERRVKRMDPEELDALMHSEEPDGDPQHR